MKKNETWLIKQDKLVHFETTPKLSRSFNWLVHFARLHQLA